MLELKRYVCSSFSIFFSVVEVRFDQPGYSTAEDQSPVTVCATLIEASIERSLVVVLSTGDDTAQGEV